MSAIDFLPINYDLPARTGVAFSLALNVDVISALEAPNYDCLLQVRNEALALIHEIVATVSAAADLTDTVDLTFFEGATSMIGPAGDYDYEIVLQSAADPEDNWSLLKGKFLYEQGLVF